MHGGCLMLWPNILVFFNADSHAKVFTGLWEYVNESLQLLFCEGGHGCIVSEEQVPDSHTLVLALRMERLNSFLSDPVCRKTPSIDAPKACFSMTAKKMLKSVGASTHPCFTPLQMLKASEVAPSNSTTPFTSVWKDCITLSSLGGHLILARTRKRLSQLMRLKALVRSINATKSARLFSLHFSWSWWREKTISIAEHFALKPH